MNRQNLKMYMSMLGMGMAIANQNVQSILGYDHSNHSIYKKKIKRDKQKQSKLQKKRNRKK